jgi:hypothetical protein
MPDAATIRNVLLEVWRPRLRGRVLELGLHGDPPRLFVRDKAPGEDEGWFSLTHGRPPHYTMHAIDLSDLAYGTRRLMYALDRAICEALEAHEALR